MNRIVLCLLRSFSLSQSLAKECNFSTFSIQVEQGVPTNSRAGSEPQISLIQCNLLTHGNQFKRKYRFGKN